MLESIFTSSGSAISLENCIISIIAAIILGGIISFTHKLTSKTTPNFLVTLAILPVLVQVIILLVNGNLGTSLAVAGAFSLVRFRSMAGNSKEILAVFWAMTIGLALGMGYILYGAIITVIVAILVIFLNKFVINSKNSCDRKLKIVIPENMDYEEVFNDIFKKYTSKIELKKAKTTNMGSMYELIYDVKLKQNSKQKSFIDEIRCRNGNMLVALERQELSEVEL